MEIEIAQQHNHNESILQNTNNNTELRGWDTVPTSCNFVQAEKFPCKARKSNLKAGLTA